MSPIYTPEDIGWAPCETCGTMLQPNQRCPRCLNRRGNRDLLAWSGGPPHPIIRTQAQSATVAATTLTIPNVKVWPGQTLYVWIYETHSISAVPATATWSGISMSAGTLANALGAAVELQSSSRILIAPNPGVGDLVITAQSSALSIAAFISLFSGPGNVREDRVGESDVTFSADPAVVNLPLNQDTSVQYEYMLGYIASHNNTTPGVFFPEWIPGRSLVTTDANPVRIQEAYRTVDQIGMHALRLKFAASDHEWLADNVSLAVM